MGIRLEPRFIEQSYRTRGVMSILRKLTLTRCRPMPKREQGLGRHCLSAPQRLDDCLLIDGARDRLPHPLVPQCGVVHVEVRVHHKRTRPALYAEIRLPAQGMHHVQRDDVRLHIARALLQFQRRRDRIRRDHKSHALNFRRTCPIAGVAFDNHFLVLRLADEAKWPRSYRMQTFILPCTTLHHAEQPITQVE